MPSNIGGSRMWSIMPTSLGAMRVSTLTELTAAVATDARAQNALEQFRKHGARRCIAFCCSQRHANFMAEFFNARGLQTVAVHAGKPSRRPSVSLSARQSGTPVSLSKTRKSFFWLP